MRKQVIIAKFEENCGWADQLTVPYYIYDKGKGELPNVGFEAHTFFHHFAEHYYELAEVTMCLQGDPFPHWKGGVERLNSVLDGIDPDRFSYVPISNRDRLQFPDGRPHHEGLGDALSRMWNALLGHPPPDLWHCWYGGQFVVHRNLIHNRPQSFWKLARDTTRSKEDACAVERMWGHIFA